jgi:hypothetical protein
MKKLFVLFFLILYSCVSSAQGICGTVDKLSTGITNTGEEALYATIESTDISSINGRSQLAIRLSSENEKLLANTAYITTSELCFQLGESIVDGSFYEASRFLVEKN